MRRTGNMVSPLESGGGGSERSCGDERGSCGEASELASIVGEV